MDAFLNKQSSGGVLAAGSTIGITISKVRNPPTLQVYANYEIYTADADGNFIEKCSGLSLILQSVGTLSTDSYVKITGNKIVNLLGTYWFYIKVTNPVPIGGWIRIVMPSEVSGTSIGFDAMAMIDSGAVLTIDSQKIDIKNGIT